MIPCVAHYFKKNHLYRKLLRIENGRTNKGVPAIGHVSSSLLRRTPHHNMSTPATGGADAPPAFFLVIANISKRCNIQSLIASAVAFGAEVLVGVCFLLGGRFSVT